MEYTMAEKLENIVVNVVCSHSGRWIRRVLVARTTTLRMHPKIDILGKIIVVGKHKTGVCL
jgi:hypothetical protein